MPSSIAIVAGNFHKELVEKMVEEARKTASENDLIVEEVSWVPGSMEVPLQLKRLLLRESIDGAVVLGIIEKGETDHGFVMGTAVTKGIIDLQITSMKPIGYGIIGRGAEDKHIRERVAPYARKAVLAVGTMLSN